MTGPDRTLTWLQEGELEPGHSDLRLLAYARGGYMASDIRRHMRLTPEARVHEAVDGAISRQWRYIDAHMRQHLDAIRKGE